MKCVAGVLAALMLSLISVGQVHAEEAPKPKFNTPGEAIDATKEEPEETTDTGVVGEATGQQRGQYAVTAGGKQEVTENTEAANEDDSDESNTGDGEGRRIADTSGEVPSTSAGDASIAPAGPPCKTTEYSVPADDGTEVWHELTLYCWVCASERIDDVRTGERSDGRGFGAYAEHLGRIGGYVTADAGGVPELLGGVAADPGSIVVRAAVGSYGELYMPVFSYCRRDDTGAMEYGEAGKSPSIGLTAYLPDNFDVDGTRRRLWDEFYPRLLTYGPDMGSTPPIEQGRLFVRLPTWFWVKNPVLEDQLVAVSDLGTIRVSIRAELQSVEWQWGAEKKRCQLDDMRAYKGHGVATLTPRCSKTFLKLGTPEIAATSRYYVEERVQYRPSRFDAWPDVAWAERVPPLVDVRTTAGPIGIGEILSLTVAGD